MHDFSEPRETPPGLGHLKELLREEDSRRLGAMATSYFRTRRARFDTLICEKKSKPLVTPQKELNLLTEGEAPI